MERSVPLTGVLPCAMAILSARELSCGYAERTIVRAVSFAVAAGEFVALAGPNGAGKSTLLRTLAGLLRPLGGEVTIHERPLAGYPRKALARMLAMVAQQFVCRLEYTVEDLVMMGRLPHEPTFGLARRSGDGVVEQVLAWTDTARLRDRFFDTLSGGEQQRVTLAMALAQQPALLLLDEPSSHLDLAHQVVLFDLLARLRRELGLTLLVVSHDLSLVAQYVDRVLLLRDGQLLYDGDVEQTLTAERLSAVYGIEVLVQPHPTTGRPVLLPRLAGATT